MSTQNKKAPQRIRHYVYTGMGYHGSLHYHFYNKVATPLHSHDYFEIFFITKGTVKHSFEGRIEKLEAGTLGLICPQEEHQFFDAEDELPVHFNIAIPQDAFKELCDTLDEDAYEKIKGGYNFYKPQAKEFEYINHLANLAYASSGKNGTVIARTIAINTILFLIGRPEEENETEKDYPEWLKTFCENIKLPEYFLLPISDLYKTVPYSQPILNARFKNHTGETIVAHISKMKINYAANLLKHSSYTILDISQMTNYNSLSHFNRTFKEHTGYTPSEYRKAYKKKS